MTRYIYILTFLLISQLTYATCSPIPKMLDPEWPEGKQRPHIALDIDHTICRAIPNNRSDNCDHVYKQQPETILIPYLEVLDPEKKGIYTHAFFADIPELIISILSWGWNIDFFSAGIHRRNVEVIPNYLKEALRPYYENADPIVDTLMESRIRIYSHHNLTEISGTPLSLDGKQSKPYKKKDLTILGVPIKDVILVEDNPDYAVEGEQSPPLCVGQYGNAAPTYHANGRAQAETDLLFESANHASYVLGALSHCRELMAEKGLSLREALRHILALPEELLQYTGEFNPSPWMLEGPSDFARGIPHTNPLVEHKLNILQRYLIKGSTAAQDLKQLRQGNIQSTSSLQPYGDLMEKLYEFRNYEDASEYLTDEGSSIIPFLLKPVPPEQVAVMVVLSLFLMTLNLYM
jgi:hypothetical protein